MHSEQRLTRLIYCIGDTINTIKNASNLNWIESTQQNWTDSNTINRRKNSATIAEISWCFSRL